MNTFGFKLLRPVQHRADWLAILYTGATGMEFFLCDKAVQMLPGFERGKDFNMLVEEAEGEPCNVTLRLIYAEGGRPEYGIDVHGDRAFTTFFSSTRPETFVYNVFPDHKSVHLKIHLSPV